MSDVHDDDFIATLRRSIDTHAPDWVLEETITPIPPKNAIFDGNRNLLQVSVGSHKTEDDFRIVGTIGEGGMGVVELAEQTALGRLVAMKSAHDKRGSKRRLLEEAQVLGRLEHPNVVPVYVLGERKDDGAPIIVMRRIEGVEWALKLKSDDVDLDYHLRILLQVCNALRFAHDRGIIHRDLKPENVMLGEFGEVYLLDWGIALSMDGEDGLPSPQTTRGLAGTLAYMAPEMAKVLNHEIDRRTDVFLLGAILHELLDGDPPHKGNSFYSVCFAAFQSDPKQYSDGVNPELGEIARRAMQKNPEDRYQTVAEFAAAIEDAIEHEASFVLSDAAKTRFDEFEHAADGVDIVRFLIEAEYGYRQSLKIWKGNIAAQKGVQRCLRARVERALHAGDIDGARSAYLELEEDPSLAERISVSAKAVEERAARVGYLEALEADQDLRQGSRARQRLVLLLMVGFIGLSLLASYQVWSNDHQSTALDSWKSYPRIVIVLFVGLLLFRKRLFGNVANRRISIIVIVLFAFMGVMRFIHMYAESSMLIGLVSEQVLLSMSAGAMGILAGSRRIAVAGLSYIVIGIIGLMIGSDWMFLQIQCIAHVIFLGTTAMEWRQTNPKS